MGLLLSLRVSEFDTGSSDKFLSGENVSEMFRRIISDSSKLCGELRGWRAPCVDRTSRRRSLQGLQPASPCGAIAWVRDFLPLHSLVRAACARANAASHAAVSERRAISDHLSVRLRTAAHGAGGVSPSDGRAGADSTKSGGGAACAVGHSAFAATATAAAPFARGTIGSEWTVERRIAILHILLLLDVLLHVLLLHRRGRRRHFRRVGGARGRGC